MKQSCIFVLKLIGNKTLETEITKILQQRASFLILDI